MKKLWISNLDHVLVRPGSPIYELKRWPPTNRQPISTDTGGSVLSVYGDDVFDFSAYANIACRIRFDDDRLTIINRRRLKQVVAWWMWGSRSRITAITVSAYYTIIKPIFLLASSLNIDACDLGKRSDCARLLAPLLGASVFDVFLMLMDELFVGRDEIGFVLLDRQAIASLRKLMPKHELQQTPYIPPRIWLYQVTQLKACVDDFLLHRQDLEALFTFCLDAYVENYGSVENACNPDSRHRLGPFNADLFPPHRYLGSFSTIAKRFGVDDLFTRWLRSPVDNKVNETMVGVQRLGAYFNLVQAACIAYIMNFTAMRSIECKSLRASSFYTEEHEEFGTIHLIRGDTTKTIREQGTVWITSPSVESAVRAAATIARLRVNVAMHDRNVYIAQEDIDDPLLYTPAYEPWFLLGDVVRRRGPRARQRIGYKNILDRYPFLFDKEQLRITQNDLHVARRITPTLDPVQFKCGKVWSLAFHQLRRTAAVNMTASGVVDTSTIQYQLKHLSREQALYYGHGFSKLNFNPGARDLFLKNVFEMLALQAGQICDSRYLSPYGPDGKQRVLNIVQEKDDKERIKAAKKGRFSLRRTIFGLCARLGPCPYGGFDNVSECGRCIDALIDSTKEGDIEAMNRDVDRRIAQSPPGSPRRKGLLAQQSSILSALNVINTERKP